MDDKTRPLLIFPEREKAARNQLTARAPDVNIPNHQRQVERLKPRFAALRRAFMEVRTTPAGPDIEKVLVFEVIGSIEGFKRAAEDAQLHWLCERETSDIAPDDDFHRAKHAERSLDGRVFVTCSNLAALGNLESLFRIYEKTTEARREDLPEEHQKWYSLFSYLKNIRPWGPEDRLRDTGLLEMWNVRTAGGSERLPVEVELWYYRSPRRRKEAVLAIASAVSELGGHLVGEAVDIAEIAYLAVLANLPADAVGRLVRHENVRLLQTEQVMFLRPVGQAVSPVGNDEMPADAREPRAGGSTSPAATLGPPSTALLDGLPLQNHRRLSGYMVVDDPDGWEGSYPAEHRRHGTAMASLIIHGELDAPGSLPRRRLYVRPILFPNPNAPRSEESLPENYLAVDLLHRAVRRMFDGDGTEPPAAASVRVINLSIGDEARPYYLYPSPWARMIDYLSSRYGVLFIVSAGNQRASIDLGISADAFATLRTNRERLELATLEAIRSQARNRRILSPAEAVNALTVGATHDDASPWSGDEVRVEPISTRGLPSPLTPHGSGFQRSIKPEVFFPGGRQAYTLDRAEGGTILSLPSYAARPPGHRVAAPSSSPGEVRHEWYCRGTSNAAALATRCAANILETLFDLKHDLGADGAHLRDQHMAALVKAILVHGASWGDAGEVLRRYFPADSLTEEKVEIARWLGYGKIDIERVSTCAEQRATLIACDNILNDFAHIYRVPLPPSLQGRRVWRRVTATLAWFTPINPYHEDYHRADLWFTPYHIPSALRPEERRGDVASLLGVRRAEANWQTVRRGTVQHEIWEGESATTFAEGNICFTVSCRDIAGSNGFVPYGFVVSVEAAEAEPVPIYDEIRSRLQIAINHAG